VGKIGASGREHARAHKRESTRKRVVTRHALKANFIKHGTNPCKQKLSWAVHGATTSLSTQPPERSILSDD
jgi:hypothetical protein